MCCNMAINRVQFLYSCMYNCGLRKGVFWTDTAPDVFYLDVSFAYLHFTSFVSRDVHRLCHVECMLVCVFRTST
uniref:Uncharacterized protein n=1 Tax=Arundo donax TaxID=35708 RepID=A0A0A9E5K2_ARUDO